HAVGLLKQEMRILGSLVMRAAESSRVPAGAALAVDRERFAEIVTGALATHPLITIVREEMTAIPESSARSPVIVATGPLTSEALSAGLVSLVGQDHLYFYDAISPIVLAESIDHGKVFRASRWGRSIPPRSPVVPGDEGGFPGRLPPSPAPVRLEPDTTYEGTGAGPACGVDDGAGDYLNCPMTRDDYDR